MFIAHHTFCSRAGSQRDAGPAHFRCNQDAIVLAANLANEAVVDVDPHHGFAVNDFLLMHDHFLDQRVQEFFGQFGDVRVNPRFPLSDRETQRRRLSANMELNPVTIMSLNGTRNGPFGGDSHDESQRKDTRNLPESRGHALGSRKCALLYRCPTCISARSARQPVRPHPNAADSPEGTMLSV